MSFHAHDGYPGLAKLRDPIPVLKRRAGLGNSWRQRSVQGTEMRLNSPTPCDIPERNWIIFITGMKKTLLLAAASLALPILASADSNVRVLSTQQLVDACKLMQDPEQKAFCIGYVSATYDTYLVTRHPEVSKSFICPSQPAPKRDDVINDFIQWSDSHQEFDAQPAADNVLRYLAERFPCKN